MASIKVIKTDFDRETGISTAEILTKYGTFTGTSKLHSEDNDITSEYIGCMYAEAKARIKYEKAKLQEFRQRYQFLDALLKDMKRINGYNEKSIEARFLRKQFFIARDNVKKQEEVIKQKRENLYYYMSNYREFKDKFADKILKNKEKRERTQEINKAIKEDIEKAIEE